MASESRDHNLAERHYVTLILRVMVDQDGQAVHGEIIDSTNTFQERFIGVPGLFNSVQSWLTQQERRSTRASASEDSSS